jgi:hypothetical protein
LIDLGQFFEILEYSSSSELAGSAKTLFGPSLHSSIGVSRREIAQTSILPEPNRVEGQEFGNSTSAMNHFDDHNGYYNLGYYSDDELAVLAENFFQQRPEIEGSANWWNLGDLGGG